MTTDKFLTIGKLVMPEKGWQMFFEIRYKSDMNGGRNEYAIYGNPFNGVYTPNKETALKRWQELTERFLNETTLYHGNDFADN